MPLLKQMEHIDKMFDKLKNVRQPRKMQFVEYKIYLQQNGDFWFGTRQQDGITAEAFGVYDGDTFTVVEDESGEFYFRKNHD